MSIYVGNLSFDASQSDLTQVFSEYGSVSRVSMPLDRETNRPRGFAFVDMSSKKEEETAIETLDGAEWMGRTLRVNEAKPRENNRSSNSAWNNSRGLATSGSLSAY